MSRLLFAIPLAALAWAGAPGIHAASSEAGQSRASIRFAEMDRNNDGVITRDEWRGSDRSFAVHDWNGDGRLSGDEVRIGGQRTPEQADHAPNRYERNLSWTTAAFNALDHNRDRRLTPNEWHFDSETFRRVDANNDNVISQQEFLQGDADDDRDDLFDDLDANNNGRVERNEWHASAAAFSRLDRNHDGVLTRFEVVGGTQYNTNTSWDEFNSLDYDHNGSIARNEWHWSLGSFDERDANRDGMLSRREFEGIYGDPIDRNSTVSRTVQVNSQQRWTDAGIDVRRGEVVTFSASGEIQMSDNSSDMATPAGSRQGRKAPDAPILNQPAGALLAKVGDFSPILVGDRATVTMPVSGRLYLGVNDDHLPDNRGSFTVTIGFQTRRTDR